MLLPIASFNGRRRVPPPVNEPFRSYAPGTPERASLKARLGAMAAQKIDMPLIVGGKEVKTGQGAQAVTPFNFTSIAGNLPTAPALMGNTVVWKPASSAIYSAYHLMKLYEAAGMPPGVINFVAGDAGMISKTLLSHRDLGGVHFTGSTEVFNDMWKTIGASMSSYRSYPRIVGETGGKDFVIAHPSADVEALAVAIVRGGFEFQGQKCSAVSRVYVPRSLWKEVRDRMVAMIDEIRMGDVRDFRNFMGAVIDKRAFDKIRGYIEHARGSATIVAGGK